MMLLPLSSQAVNLCCTGTLQPQPSVHFVTTSWEETGQEKAACENSIRAGRAAGLHPTSTHPENLWSHHGDQAGGREGTETKRRPGE